MPAANAAEYSQIRTLGHLPAAPEWACTDTSMDFLENVISQRLLEHRRRRGAAQQACQCHSLLEITCSEEIGLTIH